MPRLEQVKQIFKQTLKLGDSFDASNAETLLLGNFPEFDSLGIISVISAIESEFNIVVEWDELSGDTFETLGTFVAYIDEKLA
jgi:acyl carrier protein